MNNTYVDSAKKFKALSDANRLKIIDILSYGDRCGCDMLICFNFNQSTLSHHLKVLKDCGFVKCRKEGHCTCYSLNNTIDTSLFLSMINQEIDNIV